MTGSASSTPECSSERVSNVRPAPRGTLEQMWLLAEPVSFQPVHLGARPIDVTEPRRNQNEARIMLCYSCAEQGIDQPAVALCRHCTAGLCMDHLRETSAHFTSNSLLASCHHDTWDVMELPTVADTNRCAEVDT